MISPDIERHIRLRVCQAAALVQSVVEKCMLDAAQAI